MLVEKKSDFLNKDKSIGASSALHPQFSPNIFLSDFVFDIIKSYGFLKNGISKVHMLKGQYICNCKNPCSTAKNGRTTYTYKHIDSCKFPRSQRNSNEWIALYKIQTIVGCAINHLKINICIAERKSRHHFATKVDLFLASISSQFTIVVAHRLSYPQCIRSLKLLVA